MFYRSNCYLYLTLIFFNMFSKGYLFRKKLKKYVNKRLFIWNLVDVNPDTGKETVIYRVVDNIVSCSYLDKDGIRVYIRESFDGHWYFLSINRYLTKIHRKNGEDFYESFSACRKLVRDNSNLKLIVFSKVKGTY